MRNRSNALTQRGGDTIVMERLTEGLRARGVEVEIDVENKADLQAFDLCHLYNFATPELTEHLARQCVAAKKPYVVTALYEDWPKFYNQMQVYFQALSAYAKAGQPQDAWKGLEASLEDIAPSSHLPNSWTAAHAAALLVTGENEGQTITKDYPTAAPIFTNHVGCDIASFIDDGKLFTDTYGCRDFVLCVGRLETRKNQLMLLKALEDSELPIVFATGGFTYQPDYAEICRNFKRRGKTLFIERLSREELISAYRAAKVHALASWYELPGIVSLEAARLGANVVATDFGTAKDYFGEHAMYASPDKQSDILNAVTAAFHKPKSGELAARVSEFTWDRSAEEALQIYQSVLKR